MKRAVKWAVGALLLLAGVAGLIVWDAHRRAGDVLRAAESETAALLASFRARPATRPVFGGEPLEGNAWDLYAVHVKALAEIPAEEEAEIPEADGTWEPDRVPDDEVLGVLYLGYEPHLAGLREALRRRVLDPNFTYEEGLGLQMPLIGPSLKASKILAGGVAHYTRMGRRAHALDLAAAGLAFAHDQRPAVIGLLVGVVIEGYVCEVLFGLLAEHGFTAAELERFSRQLDQLDALRPSPAAAWDEEELCVRCSLVMGWQEDTWGLRDSRNPGWRQLWSWTLNRAQSVSALPAYSEELRRAIALPPHVRAEEVQRFLKEWPDQQPPLLGLTFKSLLPAFIRDVESLSLRTLLRVSVALAWYEVERGRFPPALEDLLPRYLKSVPVCPLTGTPLGYKDGSIWSRGRDGADDGGACDPEDPRRFDKRGTDVVVTVKRRK